MFNGKEKVRRTYVEWKKEFYPNLTTATGVKKKFQENGSIFVGYKKQPFFVENDNLINKSTNCFLSGKSEKHFYIMVYLVCINE